MMTEGAAADQHSVTLGVVRSERRRWRLVALRRIEHHGEPRRGLARLIPYAAIWDVLDRAALLRDLRETTSEADLDGPVSVAQAAFTEQRVSLDGAELGAQAQIELGDAALMADGRYRIGLHALAVIRAVARGEHLHITRAAQDDATGP